MVVDSPPGMIRPSRPLRCSGKRTSDVSTLRRLSIAICSAKSPCKARTPIFIFVHYVIARSIATKQSHRLDIEIATPPFAARNDMVVTTTLVPRSSPPQASVRCSVLPLAHRDPCSLQQEYVHPENASQL